MEEHLHYEERDTQNDWYYKSEYLFTAPSDTDEEMIRRIFRRSFVVGVAQGENNLARNIQAMLKIGG